MQLSTLLIFGIVNFCAAVANPWVPTGALDFYEFYRAVVLAVGIPMILKMVGP